jgi:hypothetical protein
MGASSRDRNPASIRHLVGSEAEAAVIAVRIAQRNDARAGEVASGRNE